MRIAVIGTAGRNCNLGCGGFEEMVEAVECVISPFDDITLTSGGAAWADHVAVVLTLENKVNNLELYIPAPFDTNIHQYEDTGVIDWRKNPGGTANYYHKRFSEISKRDSLLDIFDVCSLANTKVFVEGGFHTRNKKIANSCDLLIAITSGENSPEDGGTLSTWNACKLPSFQKIHISTKYWN